MVSHTERGTAFVKKGDPLLPSRKHARPCTLFAMAALALLFCARASSASPPAVDPAQVFAKQQAFWASAPGPNDPFFVASLYKRKGDFASVAQSDPAILESVPQSVWLSAQDAAISGHPIWWKNNRSAYYAEIRAAKTKCQSESVIDAALRNYQNSSEMQTRSRYRRINLCMWWELYANIDNGRGVFASLNGPNIYTHIATIQRGNWKRLTGCVIDPTFRTWVRTHPSTYNVPYGWQSWMLFTARLVVPVIRYLQTAWDGLELINDIGTIVKCR